MNKRKEINFKNMPKLSGNVMNKDQDERRLLLASKIEHWLENHTLFKDKEIMISFFQNGTSGLTCLLDIPGKKYVLKVLLRPGGAKGEPEFLRAWESVGVATPHVYEYGDLEGHPYVLMSYIDAQSLENYHEDELLEKGIFKKIGEALRSIHQTKSKGFGLMLEDGIGMYRNFESWLTEFQQTINQLSYMEEHNILPVVEFGSVDDAKKVLLERIGDNTETTYCHWDLTPGNILYTDPLTVFDPVPNFNHPYVDIARSIIQTIGVGYTRKNVSSQFLEGYFADTAIDKEFLNAAILFICHTKMPHWHKTGEDNILHNVKSHLLSRNM